MLPSSSHFRNNSFTILVLWYKCLKTIPFNCWVLSPFKKETCLCAWYIVHAFTNLRSKVICFGRLVCIFIFIFYVVGNTAVIRKTRIGKGQIWYFTSKIQIGVTLIKVMIAICSNMDGPRDYHTKWSKSDRERHIIW